MSDNIPNTLSARQAEHDPNFMLSLARGLEVLNAFPPPAPAADHFPAQPENANLARGGTPLFVYPRRAGHGAQSGWP